MKYLEYATDIRPELTTVRIPYFEEGEMAARELMEYIEGGKTKAAIHFVPAARLSLKMLA